MTVIAFQFHTNHSKSPLLPGHLPPSRSRPARCAIHFAAPCTSILNSLLFTYLDPRNLLLNHSRIGRQHVHCDVTERKNSRSCSRKGPAAGRSSQSKRFAFTAVRLHSLTPNRTDGQKTTRPPGLGQLQSPTWFGQSQLQPRRGTSRQYNQANKARLERRNVFGLLVTLGSSALLEYIGIIANDCALLFRPNSQFGAESSLPKTTLASTSLFATNVELESAQEGPRAVKCTSHVRVIPSVVEDDTQPIRVVPGLPQST